MSVLPIPVIACAAVLTAQVAFGASIYSQYRGVSIGDSPATVVAALKATAADVVVVTARPALVEQITWRPNQFFTGRTAPPDALSEMVLTFHGGKLARIVATYERDGTEGLTDADLHAAFSAAYGTAMLVPTPAAAEPIGEPRTIGRWGDGETLVVLWRAQFPRRVSVTVSSVAGERMMEATMASAKRLDAIEAPAWDIVRRTSLEFSRQQRAERARVDNRSTFKP